CLVCPTLDKLLICDEAELAGVLAHEMTHVIEKHTISAMQKKKLVERGANETLKGNATLLNAYVDNAFELVFAGFGRAEEIEADSKGIGLANQAGYAPNGLNGFLNQLQERNKSASEKQGLFASHPEMKERIDRITKQIATDKLAGTARSAERYVKLTAAVAAIERGASSPKADEPPKSGAF